LSPSLYVLGFDMNVESNLDELELVDCHAHIYSSELSVLLPELIQRAEDANVTAIMNVRLP
jgi:hypothetical protein